MPNFWELKQWVPDFTKQLHFPAEAQAVFADALEKIRLSQEASSKFTSLLLQYENTEHCQYRTMLEEASRIAASVGIHEYTVHLLLFLCLAKKLRSRYEERRLPLDIFYHSMMDLRYKLEECRLVYGITGSFVAYWFRRFFDLTRFALGRLQFETVQTKVPYRIGGLTIHAGSDVLNVHIPRSGEPLRHEKVLEAYALAAQMFQEQFCDQPMVFHCDSWLLDPWNRTALSPSSNLAVFMQDYKIVETGLYEDYSEVWRLFDCLYQGDAMALPRDSSFRRAYADRILRGEPTGWGTGIFLYKDGQIIND